MTNEQLTQEVMNIKEQLAKAEAEHEKFELVLGTLQEDVKTTKTIAEDVHIMAINMKNMQVTQDNMQVVQEDINKKVDALTTKEFAEYKENKKIIKQNLLSAFIGAVGTAIIAFIGWSIKEFIKKGGV